MKAIRPFWVGCVCVLALVVWASPVLAKKAGGTFRVSKGAKSLSSKNSAKRIARKKAIRSAKRRCGRRKVARASRAWSFNCSKKRVKGMFVCRAGATFRCVGSHTKWAKRKGKKKARHAKRARRHAKRARRHAKRARRHARRSKRAARKSRSVGRCLRKFVRSAVASAKGRAAAMKKGRALVYRSSKGKCSSRRVSYVGSWKYKCQKKGGSWTCRASNAIRCCSGKKRARRTARRTKRRRKTKKS